MAEIDLNEVQRLVDERLITARPHARLPLRILNYTPRCQYERAWTPMTLQCRGLIVDDQGSVVGRSFRKFFNDVELPSVPWHQPHVVTEKMDGSMFIVTHFRGERVCATRGSFDSEQAREGALILDELYAHVPLDPSITYCFEVIYPENRIIVDYGARRDLVLLAMIETATGRELPLDQAPAGLTVVRTVAPASGADALRSLIADDQEGYVVRFDDGTRVKVKGLEYMRVQRLLIGMSARTIWEFMKEGKPLDEVLERVPDEFAEWVRGWEVRLTEGFEEFGRAARALYDEVRDLPDRKSQAIYLQSRPKDLAAAVFRMIDGASYDEIAWRRLRPEAERAEIAARADG